MLCSVTSEPLAPTSSRCFSTGAIHISKSRQNNEGQQESRRDHHPGPVNHWAYCAAIYHLKKPMTMHLTIELYQQAYEKLGEEFGQKFKDVGHDFRSHFIEASDNVTAIGFKSGDEYIEAIRVVLSDVLQYYVATKATTRVGRWLRAAAYVLSKIIPFVKVKKVRA